MRVITGGAGSGKTTQLIQECAKHGGYIVCPERRDALRIAERAKALDLDINFPITVDEFYFGKFSSRIKSFYFDDIDRILPLLTRGIAVKAISLTTQDAPDKETESGS